EPSPQHDESLLPERPHVGFRQHEGRSFRRRMRMLEVVRSTRADARSMAVKKASGTTRGGCGRQSRATARESIPLRSVAAWWKDWIQKLGLGSASTRTSEKPSVSAS